MRTDPDSLKKEAHAIASAGKSALQTWHELRSWASARGPLAMKSAMMEFLGAYGGTPDAAYVMPEVMRNASSFLSPQERVGVMHAALSRPRPGQMRQHPMLAGQKPGQGPGLMPRIGRPDAALAFRPARPPQSPPLGRLEPLVPAHDHAYLRNIHVMSRDRLETALPKPPARKQAFASAVRPAAREMPAHGERIVTSLISKLRSHAADVPHLSAPSQPKRKAPKRKAKAARRKPARTRKAAARRPAMRKTQAKPAGRAARKGAAAKRVIRGRRTKNRRK
jgi:hypothetical protein